jgi:hypothetical protein
VTVEGEHCVLMLSVFPLMLKYFVCVILHKNNIELVWGCVSVEESLPSMY